ncbi:MAG: efflux RND transporter periplasmic adaptor subunit [Woeseia sp.]
MKPSLVLSMAAIGGVIVAAGLLWLLLDGRGSDLPTDGATDMRRYRAAGLEIGVATLPATPQVGENRLIVELRTPEGVPVPGIEMTGYAEMPAMGAMPAMRAPAEMREVAPGRYTGNVDLAMRGEWPLTLRFGTPDGQPVRLQFDLATDRPDMPLAAGGTAVDSAKTSGADATAQADAAAGIHIDNRRRQLIGLKTGEVIRRNLVKPIRAVGEIAFDERLLSQVALRFDGYIGDLKADYVGMPIEKGQLLFTVYSPKLLAAQQEYLEAVGRRSNGDAEDPLVRAARQRLELWDFGAVEFRALERRGAPLDYVPFHAPRSGTLIERNIADGSAATAGQTLLTIADLSRIWVEAKIFEADFELVRPGTAALITLPHLPRLSYSASVEFVYPWLEEESRTGRVRFTLDNADGQLKPGMYAEVSLRAELGGPLSVPEEAVIFAGESRVVFRDLGEGRLEPVTIETGRRAGGFVEVLDGLSSGDRVVTSGNFLIAAERRLKAGMDSW